MKWLVNSGWWLGITLVFWVLLLDACSTLGERDNPMDPQADNFDATIVPGYSSEAPNSSASENLEKASWGYLNTNVNYGLIVDARDMQQYKTVAIGEQVWLAENMNYVDLGACYELDDRICEKMGRLYNWAEAKLVCPEGFHLPTKAEWDKLSGDLAMMAKKGWALEDGMVGSDEYGFSLLPAGFGIADSLEISFEGMGSDAMLWTATESANDSAYSLHMFSSERMSERNSVEKYYMSVRCVGDADASGL